MSNSEDGKSRIPKLILGLGNPGAEYGQTRHNFGFWVLDEVAKRLETAFDEEICHSLVARTSEVDLAKPLTFMNRSGFAARCLSERWNYLPENVLVVYDEVSLPLGTMRLRTKGSPGGHRGMESVIENLRSSKVHRLRLGIASLAEDFSSKDLAEFVLEPFEEGEWPVVEREVDRAAEACLVWLQEGASIAMNRFNQSTTQAGDVD